MKDITQTESTLSQTKLQSENTSNVLQRIKFPEERVVLLGDCHFGARSDSKLFHDRFELFFNYMFDYMKKNDLKLIIQFGDLFDRRKYINFHSLNRSRVYFFDKLKEYGFRLVTLIGNHDIPYKNTLESNSPSLLLGEYSKVITLIEEPTILKIGNTSSLVIPWICNDNEEACVQAITESTQPLCFGHFELAGFEMYKGAVCEHGLAKDLFWKFNHVYSGHFHHISSKDNITYLGSPYQITWADYGDERGFFVLDTNDLSTTFIENPYPNFFKINYDDEDNKFTLKDLEEADYSIYNRTFVKVIVTNKTNLYLYDKFIEKLEAAGAVVHAVEDHKYKNVKLDEESLIDGEDSISDIAKKAAEQYGGTIDKKQLTTYIIELYNRAVNTTQV